MAFWFKKVMSVSLFIPIVATIGCGGGGTPSSSPGTAKDSQPEGTTAPTPTETGQEAATPAGVPAAHGVVLANKELGMTVSGQGSANPARSLDVLGRQVMTLLPDLRDIYERERSEEPGLMGSLDVSMTIEPNGTVSDLRFPVKRVSNDRLTSAVFEQLRTWTFPPDDLSVQLRFTLLFVPPGMDEASILLWEKRLGSRPVIEKMEEAPTPVIAAVPPEQRPSEELPKPHREGALTPPHENHTEKGTRPPTVVAARPNKSEAPGRAVPGWYRVLQPTVLRADPDISSRAVARLRQGLRVRVVGVVKGRWLEVRSISDRPPGFLRSEDAAPERAERAERR